MAAGTSDTTGLAPDTSFEGGSSTGPFTPAGPNQSVDNSSPGPGAGDDNSEDDGAYDAPAPQRSGNSSGFPALIDTGFDDVDQFANQREIDRAFNDAVFREGDYDARQQQLQDTITAIDHLIPSDVFIIVGGEAKDTFLGLQGSVKGFGVVGLDRTTYDAYAGGAVVAGPGVGPLTFSAGGEWTTEAAEASSFVDEVTPIAS